MGTGHTAPGRSRTLSCRRKRRRGNGVGPATALPSSIANAASWDLTEANKYGSVIGAELAAYGMNVNLGGNTNLIGREPRDGRTFETKGEDPILAGKIAAAHIDAHSGPARHRMHEALLP